MQHPIKPVVKSVVASTISVALANALDAGKDTFDFGGKSYEIRKLSKSEIKVAATKKNKRKSQRQARKINRR